MGSPARLILSQTIDLIEPLTRFDRSSITLRDEDEQTVACTGVWTSSVSYSPNSSDGKGKLPSGVLDAGSQGGMEQEIERLLSRERALLSQRLEQWCNAQIALKPAGHEPLALKNCFSGTKSVGYGWQCSACTGKGNTTCTFCNGNRQVTCTNCRGAGWNRCNYCNGAGHKTCSNCNGQRGSYRQIEHAVFNAAANEYTKRYENVWESCRQCQDGKVPCHACSTSGKNYCVLCSRTGKINCAPCLGRGYVTCKACDGKGAQHRIAETTCKITNSFNLRTEDAESEVKQTTSAWDFPTFTTLAAVSSFSPKLSSDSLSRTYPATLLVTQARIHCANQDFVLLGYGDPARVFDFKGIVAHLLSGDLQNLQSALAQPGAFLPFRNQSVLSSALAVMLESEVNQQLCDNEKKQALVANGTVTQQHADTTASALRKSIGRIYSSAASVSLAAFSVVLLLTLTLLYRLHYMIPQNRPTAFMVFLGVLAVAAVVAEVLARTFVLRQFAQASNAAQRQAASRFLRSVGTIMRWRIAAAAATIGAIVAFFAVVTH